MSSIIWDNDNLIQKAGDNVEYLGHVKYDQNAKEFVLWLKDARSLFGSGNGFVRGDAFPTMRLAKSGVIKASSVRIVHHLWLTGLKDRGQHVSKAIADIEDSKPLTESTFEDEMDRMRTQLGKAANKQVRMFWAGLSLGVFGAIVGIAGLWVAIMR